MNNIITANFYPGKCPGMPVCSYATGYSTGYFSGITMINAQ